MTFEETLEVLRGLPGRMIDVSVWRRGHEQQGHSLASFSGTVDRVDKATVWFEDAAPGPVCFTVDPRIFDGADVEADSGLTMEEVLEEGANEHGTTWTIWIRQAGLVLDVMVYV